MLNTLRNAANSWAVRFFLFILLLCFALLWGTANYNNVQKNDVLISGNSKITEETYNYALRDQLMRASISLGLNHIMRVEEAAKYGIPQYVADQMVENVLLKEQARILKIGVSNDKIAKEIASEPNFIKNGHFDKQFFKNYAQRLGVHEKTIINYYAQQAKNKQLLAAISFGLNTPETFYKAFKLYDLQTRSIEYLKLKGDYFWPKSPPADSELKKWLEAHKDQYKAPEYRKMSVLRLYKDNLIKPQEIKEQAIKESYEKNKTKYTTAEKRDYDIITFKNKEDAANAEKKLKEGMDFATLFKQKDLFINAEHKENIQRSELDPKIAESIFNLKDGQTSAVITSIKDEKASPKEKAKKAHQEKTTSVSSEKKQPKKEEKSSLSRKTDSEKGKAEISKEQKAFIVYMKKITPQIITPLSKVEGTIRNELADAKADETLKKYYEEIKTAYNKGEKLEDLAKKYNLPFKVYTIDFEAKDEHGQKISDFSNEDFLLKAVFKTEIGMKHEALSVPKKGYIWYDILNITPERYYTYNEVKNKIIQRWNNEETENLLEKNTKDILKKLNDGKSLSSIAHDFNIKVEVLNNLHRYDDPKSISMNALSAVFSTAYNKYGSYKDEKDDETIIFKVTNVQEPKDITTKHEEQKDIMKQLTEYFKTSLLINMLNYLHKEYGIQINSKAYERVTKSF